MVSVFAPATLAGLRLQSRFVRSATAERMRVDTPDDGQRLGQFYAALAKGGVGLIVTGHITVDPSGRVGTTMPGLYSDGQIEGWRAAAGVVHDAGGLLCAQINHGGGRAKPESGALEAGLFAGPVCVSPLPSGEPSSQRAKDPMAGEPLTPDGIEKLIAAYAAAAVRARQAGLDAVQIHAAHGYLGSQFLSPSTNHRQDEWGGSLEGRARFLRRVVQAVREAVGGGFPVGMKLGAMDSDQQQGLRLDDSLQAAQWFEQDGLDFIEISGAFHAGVAERKIRPGKGEAYYLPAARKFKERLTIPVISVGGYRSLAVIEEALNSGGGDFIAMSRPLIRQPNLPHVLREGGQSECLSCNLCLLTRDGATRCHAKDRQAVSR